MGNFSPSVPFPVTGRSLLVLVLGRQIAAEQELRRRVCQVRVRVGHGQRRLGRRGRPRVQEEAGAAQEGAEEGRERQR